MKYNRIQNKSPVTRSGVVGCWTYQFAEWESPFYILLQVSGALRYLQLWTPDSLQRSPGQPAVSQKRDQNDLPPFCHKYYSEVGGGGVVWGGRWWWWGCSTTADTATERSSGWCPLTFQVISQCFGVLRLIPHSTRRATPVHFYAADLCSIPHTDRPNAWLCASGSLERSRSIPATNTVICKRSEEGGGGEGFCW